jgi:uncharacterized SAM-binding protein YcdF (DUF218 family)
MKRHSEEAPFDGCHAASPLTVARALALFLGSFDLLNLLGDLKVPGFNANLWWIDLRVLPTTAGRVLLLVSGSVLLLFAVKPPNSAWRKIATAACAIAVAAVCMANSAAFFVLYAKGRINPAVPMPLSLLIGLGMALVAATAAPQRIASKEKFSLIRTVAFACILLWAFPVAQMFCFGKTDYRRPADAVVVLGARVYADGTPSDALRDRVNTACSLYREGLAKTLVFSGGAGNGALHETDCMRQIALEQGVAPRDIILDKEGRNTQATVFHTQPILARLNASRVLVVSHYYHLPRVKLAFQRAGWDVYTVPVREPPWYLHPYNVVREVGAFWAYFFRPLVTRNLV